MRNTPCPSPKYPAEQPLLASTTVHWMSYRVALLFFLVLAPFVRAQDHTVLFSTSDVGVSTVMTNWGLDTCWPSFDNMQRGLFYMGTNNVTVARVGFTVDAPLTNNDVTPAD